MWSSLATRYQLGLTRQAGSVTAPLSASTPHGTGESAMNAAGFGETSAAKEARNFSRPKKRRPSPSERSAEREPPAPGWR